MTQFGDRSNNNSPPVREQSWPTPSLLTPNEMRVFDPTHAGDSRHPHYTLPKYNTGLFPVYFIDCNYKADSKQSTIMQLTFQNLEIPQDYEGRNFTSQTGPKEPTPVLGLWGRMFHFPIDLSSMIRPGTGFPCWNALCSFFFFLYVLLCWHVSKEKILCNYKTKCSEMYSCCNNDLFLYKIKLYGLCVNYFVSETPVPFPNIKV